MDSGHRLTGLFQGLVVFLVCFIRLQALALQLPDTSGIDGQLTANHNIDHFFSLWLIFNNDDVQISDKPFTIFAPQNSPTVQEKQLLRQPELVKRLLLDHVVPDTRFDIANVTANSSITTLSGKTVQIWLDKNGKLKANNASIVENKIEVPNGNLVIIDSYLFPITNRLDYNESAISAAGAETNMRSADDAVTFPIAMEITKRDKHEPNTKFVENVLEVLSFLKSRVRVFQHFLSRSNVSQSLNEGEEYTVFVPTDHAFQRWHPIDWGFYPFSVPEFTESIIINHFIKGRLKQNSIQDGQAVRTLGGREIVFKKIPNLMVNGASIVKGDTPVKNGNIMFIGEVLFINESVVSKLHQQNRDKETPPLLAFPWFGAQFLSHAFLALERDKRFKHITRFLNLADLAPHVSGTGYTFFVPVDTAFEDLGLNKMPDNYLSNGEGLQILLNHFVKGRLYDHDLKNNTNLVTLGNQTIAVNRTLDHVYVNDANILESEVFVYNLGTMFYVDKVLFANVTTLPSYNADVPPGTDNPTEETLEDFTQKSFDNDETEIISSTRSETTTNSFP
ncbi:transforming growth factor-beta-induced protein ig-h3 [Cylas formicarius]|uniref:transforming growth factor-beta-induced protein ig-h3 n=1 Tax=Cylas formicarius TaxID=197179 RepID=UPI00295864D4|nr:transforming growth factor-beta-induced protein ig-h3 [Cylas formicarius]